MKSLLLPILGIIALPVCLSAQTKHAIVPYLNELPLIINDSGDELNPNATLVWKKNEYLFVSKNKEQNDYDMEEIKVENNYAHWRFGWSGTGGSTYTDVHCFLLQTQPNPRILVIAAFEEDGRFGSVYMEELAELEEAYAEKYPKLTEDSISSLAQARIGYDWQFLGERQHDWDNIATWSWDVYEKVGGVWKNRTSELLPMDVWRNNLDTYLPCLEVIETSNIPKTEQPLKIARKIYEDAQIEANEAIFKEWLGGVNAPDIKIEAINTQMIALELSETRKLSLDCSKTPFELKGLPKTKAKALETRACPSLEFGKTIRYEGKIGQIPIEMEVIFEAGKEQNTVKMAGSYWYKNKKDKFPVEGIFGNQLGNQVNFNRIKDGKPREEFSCYWTTCTFKGAWMHLETEIAHEFELKLVK